MEVVAASPESARTNCLRVSLVEPRVDLVTDKVLDKLLQRRLLKKVADHRSGVDHRALLALPASSRRAVRRAWIVGGTQPASSSPARHTPSSSHRSTLVHHHRQQLLDEERVSVRRLDDPRARRRRSRRRRAGCRRSARLASCERARGQADHLLPLGAASRAGRGARRKGGARGIVSGRSDVVDEVQQRGFGPVQVLEDEYEWAATGERLDELARGPEHLGERVLLFESPTAEASRSKTSSFPSPSSPASFARAAAKSSSSSMPDASRRASTSGQNVIPSPYGRHRPRSTRACSAAAAQTWPTRRDLPTPRHP